MAAPEMITAEGPGNVINDFYSIDDYVKRRAVWLGKLPQYEHLDALFPIARYDAQMVFSDVEQSQLSVQEVRRREAACGIDPPLPFPTSENCLTVDTFASYPQREWSPGVKWPVTPVPMNDGEDGEARGLPTPSPSRNASNQSRQEAYARAGSSRGAMSHSANIDRDIHAFAQTSRRSTIRPHGSIERSSSSSPVRRSTFDSSNSGFPSSTPTTPIVPPRPLGVGEETYEKALARDIARNLGLPMPERRFTETLALQDDDRVASYGNRGVARPVKPLKRKRNSQADHDGALPTDVLAPPRSKMQKHATVTQQAPEEVQVKKPKLKLKLSKTSRTVSSSPPVKSSAPARSSAPAKSSATSKSNKSTRKAPTIKSDRLDAIISGAFLPRTIAEAKEASTARHQQLLAQQQQRKRSSRALAAVPDAMPEFFNPANFVPGLEDDSVRCVCGDVDDDGGKMLQCEECTVWQHVKCMGGEPEHYLCQVCDPWAHRELIAQMRKKKPLR